MSDRIQFRYPRNYGYIEYNMHDEVVKHIWDCINTSKGNSAKYNLVGQIDKSYELNDKKNWLRKYAINKLFNKTGVYPPELISVEDNCYNFIINYLKERNVILKTKTN